LFIGWLLGQTSMLDRLMPPADRLAQLLLQHALLGAGPGRQVRL
jgi:hypothetical protein